jgi:hypothetical protein
METIRAVMIAGAAFALLNAAIPAQAQSQPTAGAPLQLQPGPDQASRAGKGGTRAKANTRSEAKPAKKAIKAASAPGSRTKDAAEPTRQNTRTAATKKPQQINHRIRAVRSQPGQRAIAAALPEVREQETSEPLAFAPTPNQHAVRSREPTSRTPREQAVRDNVMRDGDSISLIGRLPWWRNNPMQPIRYGSAHAESKVMAAAEAWVASNSWTPDEAASETSAQSAPEEESVSIAQTEAVNELDLAASAVQAPPSLSFLPSLIALIGGALAAAVSARFLLA